MKLSELENRARQKQEEQAALVLEQQLEQQIAAEEAAKEFRQEVIAWMVQDGKLDATELGATLKVENHRNMQLRLCVPDHTDITFQVQREPEGGFAVRRDGRIDVDRSFANYTRCCYGLGDALVAAAAEWQQRVEAEAEDTRKHKQREEAQALREQEAAERGAKYLAMLDAHPILRPILDLLYMVMEEREQFAEDMFMAEEFAAGVETSLQEKLEQAHHDADCYARERDDLQRDLCDTRDELDREKRKARRGW